MIVALRFHHQEYSSVLCLDCMRLQKQICLGQRIKAQLYTLIAAQKWTAAVCLTESQKNIHWQAATHTHQHDGLMHHRIKLHACL